MRPSRSITSHQLAFGRRGFTLLEMLVVLVLMSFVTLLVSQALAQVARVERLLAGAQLEGAITSVRVSWAQAALESMLPMSRESGARFEGGVRRISGMSSQSPAMPTVGLAKVSMTLEFDPRLGVTELRMALGQGSGKGAAAAGAAGAVGSVLISWPGNSGRFRFMDDQGRWHDNWPMDQADAVLLPVAVLIETGLDEAPRIVASMAVAPLPLPSRQSLQEL